MEPNLSDLIFVSSVNAFKNNALYTGTFSFSGSVSAGANIKTFTVPLDSVPDMVSIVFNGPNSTLDSRPAAAWFRQGMVGITGTGGVVGPGYITPWQLYGTLNGAVLTITATYTQTFIDTIVLDTTSCSYRLVDYSVF